MSDNGRTAGTLDFSPSLALREPSSQLDAAGLGEVRSVLRWAPALLVSPYLSFPVEHQCGHFVQKVGAW